MEKIGTILKEKRLEKGYTVEAISAKTRLTVKYIHAIEDGDISYFKDDLSYLRYFLRSYCDALDIDFEEIKPLLQASINDYTETFTMNAVKDHEQIEANVMKNTKKISQPVGASSIRTVKKHRKPDFSLITLIGIVAVIVVCLVWALFNIFPELGKQETATPDTKAPVVETPKPEKKDEKEDEKTPTDEKTANKVTVTQSSDLYNFDVAGLKDGDEVTVQITFKSNAWFAFSVDNVQLAEPASRVYNMNEVITYKTAFKAGSQLSMRFGYMAVHEIKVNDELVKLDPSVTSNTNPASIILTMKGQ